MLVTVYIDSYYRLAQRSCSGSDHLDSYYRLRSFSGSDGSRLAIGALNLAVDCLYVRLQNYRLSATYNTICTPARPTLRAG